MYCEIETSKEKSLGEKPELSNKEYLTFKSEKNDNLLIEACYDSNIKVAELLIKNGIDLNAKNFRGETALMIACVKTDIPMIKLLVSSGADLNETNNNNCSATIFMLQYDGVNDHSEKSEFLEIIKYFVDNGYNLINNKFFGNELCEACYCKYYNVVEYLIKQGVDINKKCLLNDWTPIMIANTREDEYLKKILIKNGAVKCEKCPENSCHCYH
jgi:ankyrin repeat protein